jgi:hypothetical protein
MNSINFISNYLIYNYSSTNLFEYLEAWYARKLCLPADELSAKDEAARTRIYFFQSGLRRHTSEALQN